MYINKRSGLFTKAHLETVGESKMTRRIYMSGEDAVGLNKIHEIRRRY